MSSLSPIERYLGLDVSRGPVELLGLHTADCTQTQVIEALRIRLARIARHPQGRSVEADEVRLALHAAAAQMLDPSVRAHMLETSQKTDSTSVGEVSGTQTNGTTHGLSEGQLLVFRQNAMALLRRSGGWNRQSMQYVAGLAHASGIPITEISRALHKQSVRRVVAKQTTDVTGQPEVRRKRRTAKKNDPMMAIVGVAGGVGIAVILSLGIYSSIRQTEQQETGQSIVDQFDESPAAQSTQLAPESTALRVDASNLLATLTEAHALLSSDTGEAGWRFERAVSWLAANWYTLPPDFLVVVDDAVREFVGAIPEGSIAWGRSIGALRAPVGEMLDVQGDGFGVAAAVWSIQFLQSSRQGQSVPDRFTDEAVAVLMRVFDGRIPRTLDASSNLADALQVVLEYLVPVRESSSMSVFDALQQWRVCVHTLDNRRSRERLVLDALVRVLRHGPSISQQRDARDAVLLLLGDVSWGSPGLDAQTRPSVVALLEWFQDPLVPTAELSVITQWLAHDVAGPRVSSTMILPRASSEGTRAALRDRYAEQWTPGELDIDSPRNLWRGYVASHLVAPFPENSVLRVQDLARSGRLQAAAFLVWSRQLDAAQLALEPMQEALPVDSLQQNSERSDRQWMLFYFASGDSLKERLDALRILEDREGVLTQGESDLLAELAHPGVFPARPCE